MTNETQKIGNGIQEGKKSDEALIKEAKKRIMRLKKGNVKKGSPSRKRVFKRGVVYLGHIPYGFFEKEIKSYFEQFGKVLRVKLSRSPKTGKSKGYAFIEFQDNDVAKIVAETMNNYLMFERLLKAEYIPPEKVHPKLFPPVRFIGKDFPTLKRREALKRIQDNPVTEEQKKTNRKRISHRVKAALSKLKAMGIEYTPQIYDPEKISAATSDVESIASTETSATKKSLEKNSSKSPAIKAVEKPTPKSLMKQVKKTENTSSKTTKATEVTKNPPKVNVSEENETSMKESTPSSKPRDKTGKLPQKMKPTPMKTPSEAVISSKTPTNENVQSAETQNSSEKLAKTLDNNKSDPIGKTETHGIAKRTQKKGMKASKQLNDQNSEVGSVSTVASLPEKTGKNTETPSEFPQQKTPQPEHPSKELNPTKSIKRTRSNFPVEDVTDSTSPGQQQKTPKTVKKQKVDHMNQGDTKPTPKENNQNNQETKKKLTTPKLDETPNKQAGTAKKTPKNKSKNLSLTQDFVVTPHLTNTPKIGKATKKESPKPSSVLKAAQSAKKESPKPSSFLKAAQSAKKESPKPSSVLKAAQSAKKESPKPSPVLKAVQSVMKETSQPTSTPKIGKSVKKETPRSALVSKILKSVKTDTPRPAVSEKVDSFSKKPTPKSVTKSNSKSKKFGTPL